MPHTKLGQKVFKLAHPDGYDKRIAVKLYELPNGMRETFFIDQDKDSVQVLCITKGDPDVVLVQQFRPGPEEVQLELPGGGMEKGEDPLDAGVRELREETGYVGDATYMGSLPYSPYSSGRRHCVLVINAQKMDVQHLDPNEFVTVLKMPLRDFRLKMKTGDIRGFDLGYMGLDYIGKL
jgi:ADP-ribose pyrophosphatase